MKPSAPGDFTIRITLPATGLAVEEFFVEFRRLVRSSLPRKQGFEAELLAREAMNNAVQHGCQGDPTKTLSCVFRLKGRSLTIVVDDSGEGFDWQAVRDSQAAPLESSGRGMELLRTIATRVRFNEKGNRVTIIKQCQGGNGND